MTVCNMTIEGGARAGMMLRDETTFAYLEDGLSFLAARNFRKQSSAGNFLPPTTERSSI